MKLFSLFDTVSGTYGFPFSSVNVDTAKRSVSFEVNSKVDSVLSANPHDFVLYCLGDFNQDTAVFDLITPPEFICKADTLVVVNDNINSVKN